VARELEDWIDSYCEYNFNTEPPYTYHLWSAISVISSVLQRKCTFEFGSLLYYPNMYVVLVGPSGESRKGTAMAPALEMLQDIGINLAAESTTRESLIRALNDSKDQIPDIEAGTLTYHSSMTIFSPELAVFLGYQNHQLLSDLTDWYDCRNKWIYRTKTMGVDEIDGVYVNLYGATTPDLIKTSLPMDAIGGGLTSRIIYVYEERKGKFVPYPKKGPKVLLDKLMADLQRIHQMRGNFTFTRGFLENWIKWYTAQEDHPPFQDSHFDGYMARRPNHVMKLSMVVSASRSDEMQINEYDLDRAIAILDLTEVKMPSTFSGVGKSPLSDTISKVMNEIGLKGKRGATKSQLMDVFYRDVSEWEMDNMLKTLLSMETFGYKLTDGDEIRYVKRSTEDERQNSEPSDEGGE